MAAKHVITIPTAPVTNEEFWRQLETLMREAMHCRECFARHEVEEPLIKVAIPRWVGPRYWRARIKGDAHVQWHESDAMLKVLSVLGLLLMVAALLGLLATHSLFSRSPVIIAVQVAAFALMVWARVTFGRRSFHAAANPTGGGLVTTGLYRFVRHPIYTAVCLFVFAGALAHVSLPAVGLALLVFLGALGRMLPEERLVLQRYPEYADYAARTKRILPLVF